MAYLIGCLVTLSQCKMLLSSAVMFKWQRSFHPYPPCEFVFNTPFAISSCSFSAQPVSTRADYLSSLVFSLYFFVVFILCFIYLY